MLGKKNLIIILLVLVILPTDSLAVERVSLETSEGGGLFSFILKPFKLIKSFFERIFFRPSTEFDFDIDVDPPIVTIMQDGTGETYVDVKKIRGEGSVELTITNWDTADITSWFTNQAPSVGSGTKLSIKTTCNTPIGEYLHTVQGERGTRTSVDSVMVTVTENTQDCPYKHATPPPTTTAATPAPHITSAPITLAPKTPAPEVPLTISIEGECIIHKQLPPDEFNVPQWDYSAKWSGIASGPVGAYLSKLIYRKFGTKDCEAWGNNCKRDPGEKASTKWSWAWRKSGSGTKFSDYSFDVCTADCKNQVESAKVTVRCKADW